MAVSALLSLVNSDVVFEVPTNEVVIDDETGNVLPAVEPISYRLYLRRGSNNIRELPGIDTERATYEGYCIQPTALDKRIQAGTKAKLDFAGSPTVECLVADCRYPFGSSGLLGETLTDVLGHKIRLVASDYQGGISEGGL